jgi:PhnB protein
MPIGDMFWGDRFGAITDPFGHAWSIATRKREVSMEDAMKAMEEMTVGCGPDAGQQG